MNKKLLIGLFSVVAIIAIGIVALIVVSNKNAKINVKFMLDDAQYAIVECKGNEEITLPTKPTKDGYDFIGWYYESEFTNTFTAKSFISKPVNKDITVYGKFDLIYHTATFIADDKTISSINFSILDTTLSEIPSVPEKEGYIGVWDAYVLGKENININAKYTPVNYTISYTDELGVAHNNPTTYNILNDTIILGAIECTGYEFKGWYDGDTKIQEITKGSHQNYNLHAEWNAINYTISYTNTKGVNNSNPLFYNIASAITLNNLTKNGYQFLGWYENNAKVTQINGQTGNKTLTAKWMEVSPAYLRTNSDYLYFGTYPQTEINDLSLEATLNTMSGTLPTSENNYSWTSYEYYMSGDVSDYMWYQDITYNDEKYRGVYFVSYRPNNTMGFTSGNNNQSDNNYYISSTYWFRFEPIKWQILDEVNGQALLLCDMIIDCQEFYSNTAERTIDENTIYPNNWEYSKIRSWLNDDFYNTAFNALQKEMILSQTLEECANNVFLISSDDLNNIEYSVSYVKRVADYAKAQGCYEYTWRDCGDWLLRTKAAYNPEGVLVATDSGQTSSYQVYAIAYGIVPAVVINLGNYHTVTYNNTKDVVNNNPVTYTMDNPDITLADLSEEGYDFVGWYDKNNQRVTTIPNNSTSDYELTARWSLVEYDINYVGTKDAINLNPDTLTIESAKITLGDIEKEGYIFDGWFIGSDEINEIPTGTHEELSITAHWTPIVYNVSYLHNDEEIATGTFTMDDVIIGEEEKALIPEKDGYGVKWLYEIAPHDIEANSSYYAIQYRITYYNSHDFILSHNNPTTYTIETPTFELEAASQAGYEFKGWQYNNIRSDEEITKIELGSTGDIILTACWIAIEYNVSYVHNDEEIAKGTFTMGDVTIGDDSIIPTKTGYNASWDYVLVPEDIVATSKYTPIEYNIVYENTFGVENTNASSYTIETETFTLVDIARKGYKFEGWFTDINDPETKVTQITLGSYGDKTLTAKWSVVTYTITYNDTKDANNTNNLTYSIETPTFELTTLSVDGYDFLGWYDNDNVLVGSITNGSTENIELTAKWKAISYAITYENIKNASNEDNYATYTIETATFDLAPVSADGYTFVGWFTDVDDETTKVEQIALGSFGNIELTAKWTIVTYTITYHDEFAIENTNATEYTIETDTFDINDLSKVGYTFVGWFTDVDDTTTRIEQIMLGSFGNIELTAKWELNVYDITYIDRLNLPNANITSYSITTVETALIDLNKEGYTFNGWYLNGTKITTIPTGSVLGDITLVANWTALSYTAEFFHENTSVGTRTFTMDDVVISNCPQIPPKNGYTAVWVYELAPHDIEATSSYVAIKYNLLYDNTFDVNNSNPSYYTIETPTFDLVDIESDGRVFNGWYDGDTKVTSITMGSTGTRILIAHWSLIPYTIEYTNLKNVDNPNSGITSYNVESSTIYLGNMSKVGYTFVGWYKNDEKITSISTGSTGNVVLVATWEAIQYDINYNNVKGANNSNKTYYTIEDDIILLNDIYINDFEFIGWFDEDDQRVTSINPSNLVDVTLTAKWEAIDYRITYAGGGSRGENPETYNVNMPNITLQDPINPGYTFLGWYAEVNHVTRIYTIDTASHKDITVYALYSVNQYTMSFVTNNGTPIAPITQNYGTRINKPADPILTYYDFYSWYSDVELQKPYTINTMPAQDITLYARWTLHEYFIGYELFDGKNDTTNVNKYTYESETITFADATKLGYTFGGWYTNLSDLSTRVESIEKHSSGDVVLYAKFTVNKYHIVFDTNGGSAMNDLIQDYGSIVTAPEAPTKPYYIFDKWYGDPNLVTIYQFTTMPYNGTTIYAKWKPIDYAITYYPNGGDVNPINPLYYNCESAQITLHNATRDYCDFAGWYTDISLQNRIYTIETGSHGALNLYAKWTPTHYNINYHTPEGTTNNNPSTYTYEDSFQLVNATHPGYTFTGWYSNSSLTTPITEIVAGSYGTINLYPAYTGKQFTISINNDTLEEYGVTYGEYYEISSIPTKESFIFDGYETENEVKLVNAEGDSLSTWRIAEDTELFAIWLPVIYTATFKDTNDEILYTRNFTILDTEIEDMPEAPSNDKYIGSWEEYEIVGENIYIYVVYTPRTFTITYVDRLNAENNNEVEYTYGASTFAINGISKDGYIFDGWFDETVDPIVRVTEIALDSYGNRTLTAHWTAIEYEAQFMDEDGLIIEERPFTMDDTEIEDIPLVPTKEYYTGEWDSYSIIPEDIRIYPIYNLTKYTITYLETKNAENANNIEYTHETPTFALEGIEQDGYKFEGWFTDINDPETEVTQITHGSFGDKTLTATWSLVEYTISYENTFDVENSNPETYNIESESIVLEAISRDGYEFVDWSNGIVITEIPTGSFGHMTLTASWTVETYSITYIDRLNAENDNVVEYTIEDGTFDINDVFADGYMFEGWFTDINDPETWVAEITQGSFGDKTLTASWTAIEYTARFLDEESQLIGESTFTMDDTEIANKPELPTKDYYDGAWDIYEIIANDIDIYVIYTPTVYTITYLETKNAENTNRVEYTVEDDTFVLTDIMADGYTFIGWYTDVEDSSIKVTQIELESHGDLVLTAGWTINTYSIIYENTYDVANTNPDEYTIETPDITLVDISRDGYTFVGWFTDIDDPETKVTQITLGSFGDKTLTAKWSLVEYGITYENTFGATNNNPIEFTTELTFTLEDISRDGYTFDGWFDETVDSEVKVTEISAGGTNSITLTAHWSIITYEIVYNNTFEVSNTNEEEYTIETSNITLEDISRDGYTFDGWFDETVSPAVEVTEIAQGSFGNMTLTAKWSIITYEITYVDRLNAENDNVVEYTIEDATFAINDISKDGYTFNGWFTDINDPETMVVEITQGSFGNKTLTASWTAIEYTATFKDGNEPVDTKTFTMDDSEIADIPTKPEKTGYTSAWASYELEPDNIDINVIYTPITYTITYNETKNATNTNPTSYTIETATITLVGITKDGYTFDGWFDETVDPEVEVTEIALGSIENKNLTAHWTTNTYNVTYENTKDITHSNPKTYTIETAAITLADLSQTGYTFAGWFNGENRVTRIVHGSTGDLTLTAHWTVNTYVASFKNTNEATVATRNFTIEDTEIADMPKLPTKDYYESAWEDYEIIADDITIYVVYTPIEYTIVYNNTLGTTNSNQAKYNIETETITLVDLTKDGYIFNGWYNINNQKVTRIVTGTTGEIILTARWILKSYSITYTDEFNVENTNPAKYYVTTPTITLVDLEKEGYTFDGWYTDVNDPETKVTEITIGSYGNMTLVAKWTAIE